MSLTAHQPILHNRLRMRERPNQAVLMYQSWRDLLFLHWRVDPGAVRRTLPEGLFVDTYDDDAYVGIVPFRVTGARLRGIPALPLVSDFLELNVRTYVYDRHGTPGVWFYSLDCNQPLAVWGARAAFGLNYRHAQLQFDRPRTRSISYSSTLCDTGPGCSITCAVEEATHPAAPGTLEFFLIERYALFVESAGKVYRGRVHHVPYPVQSAKLETSISDLLLDRGFVVNESTPDDVRAAAGVDVEIFGLQEVE
jgi:uncharacterized protein YqjF (DUF2071 family)